MTKRPSIHFEAERCIQCWACEVACKQWNEIPAGQAPRCWGEEQDEGVFPHLKRIMTFHVCKQCEQPECVAACPTQALIKEEISGVVLVDAERCILCRRCAEACPFDVPQFGPRSMDKCDRCLSCGVAWGSAPHCVATCPTQALRYEGEEDEAVAAQVAAAVKQPEPAVQPERVCDPARQFGSAEQAQEAALSWRLLGSLLLEEVPVRLLEQLKNNADAAVEGGVQALDPWHEWAKALEPDNLAAVTEDLAVEFAALLAGMSAHPVHSYESVYDGGNGILMGPSRDDVVRAYAQAGYHEQEGLRLPEDHLGIELSFVAQLCEDEAQALAQGDVAQAQLAAARRQAFVDEHLKPWVGAFCEDLKARAQSPFYQGLASLIDALVSAS